MPTRRLGSRPKQQYRWTSETTYKHKTNPHRQAIATNFYHTKKSQKIKHVFRSSLHCSTALTSASAEAHIACLPGKPPHPILAATPTYLLDRGTATPSTEPAPQKLPAFAASGRAALDFPSLHPQPRPPLLPQFGYQPPAPPHHRSTKAPPISPLVSSLPAGYSCHSHSPVLRRLQLPRHRPMPTGQASRTYVAPAITPVIAFSSAQGRWWLFERLPPSGTGRPHSPGGGAAGARRHLRHTAAGEGRASGRRWRTAAGRTAVGRVAGDVDRAAGGVGRRAPQRVRGPGAP